MHLSVFLVSSPSCSTRQLMGMPFPSPGDLPNPGIEPRSSALQADSLPADPQGKHKYTGVGSLSLLQQIFPIQESNWGLLPCRRILYQLSYPGSGAISNYGKYYTILNLMFALQSLGRFSLNGSLCKYTKSFISDYSKKRKQKQNSGV